jgi:hypothetical protein
MARTDSSSYGLERLARDKGQSICRALADGCQTCHFDVLVHELIGRPSAARQMKRPGGFASHALHLVSSNRSRYFIYYNNKRKKKTKNLKKRKNKQTPFRSPVYRSLSHCSCHSVCTLHRRAVADCLFGWNRNRTWRRDRSRRTEISSAIPHVSCTRWILCIE